MRKTQFLVSVSLLVLLVVACAPVAAPAPQAPVPQAPAPALAPVGALTAPAKMAWQERWEKTLADARKEGKVVISTTAGGELRAALARGFKDAYGINMEVLAGRSAERLPKILTERRAGLYLIDANISGYTGSTLGVAKPAGILERLDPSLILPDLTDPERINKVWYQGALPWVDKDNMVFVMTLNPQEEVVINTGLVKSGELKSYRDLLNPKWQGKIVIGDPTVAGAAQQSAAYIGFIMGLDYLKEMLKMKPTVMRDQRLMLLWIAQGKFAIGIGPRQEELPEFYKIGAPMESVFPVEGTRLSGGSSGVNQYKDAPHPNATVVFLNWLFSKEAQEIYCPLTGLQSTRLDVSTAYLLPSKIRQSGVKYPDTYTEEYATRADAMKDQINVLFTPLIK